MRATTQMPVNAKCPVDGTPVKTFRIMSTNTLGGIDRDLLQHAAGSDPLMLVAATCPTCHYSEVSARFEEKIPPEVLAKIKGGALVLPERQCPGVGPATISSSRCAASAGPTT